MVRSRGRPSKTRPELERIRQMIDEDNLEGRIHADCDDPKLAPARLDQYRSLMRNTGMMRLWAHGKSKPFELILAFLDRAGGGRTNPARCQSGSIDGGYCGRRGLASVGC